MADGSDQIRRGRKFDQVLEGARDVFMKDGFEGASVDDIARAANVSKATLYSYFPDKRLLFSEVAQAECRRQADLALVEIDTSAAPKDVLTAAGHRMLGFMLSDFGQQMFRISVAESSRFPELGQSFYHRGPMVVRAVLVEYLQKAIARDELAINDLELAADQFAELCKANLFLKTVFGIDADFDQAEITRVVDGAVEMFLARYGT